MFDRKLISNHILNETLKHIKDRLIDGIDKGVKEVPPECFVVGMNADRKKGDLGIEVFSTDMIEGLPEDQDEKQAVFVSMGHSFVHTGITPIAVFFICEAWMATVKNEKELLSRKYVPPSKRPDRIEVVSLAGMTAQGQTGGVVLTIDRDENDNLVVKDTLESEFGSDNEMGSSLLEAFFCGAAYAIEERQRGVKIKHGDTVDLQKVMRTLHEGIKGNPRITKDRLN